MGWGLVLLAFSGIVGSTGARASTIFKAMTRALDTTNCPGWGDLTRLSDRGVENAFGICHARIKFDAMCAEAMPFIKAENDFRWENGGKEEFRAMIKRELGRESVV